MSAYDDQLVAVISLLTRHLGSAGHDASWEPLAEQILETLGVTIAPQRADEDER